MAKTTTTTSWLPDYVEQPTRKAMSDLERWLGSGANSVYGTRRGEDLYTPMDRYQERSINNVGWLANQNLERMFGLKKAENAWDRYSSGGPNLIKGNMNVAGIKDPRNVKTERLVDENGWLGSIDSYMNPYTDKVLDPVIRELTEEDARQRNNIGASATMSGAFGDARHGIMEGEQSSRTNEAISDSTGRIMSDAYNNAMGLRSADIGRKAELDVGNVNRDLEAALANLSTRHQNMDRTFQKKSLNQQARERSKERLGTAATAYQSLGDSLFDKYTSVNDALFNAGELRRNDAETQRRIQQDYVTALREKRYNDAIKLLSAAQGAPKVTNSVSEQESDDGLWGLLGAGLGAFFG